jgi:Na+-driven multidrug efflux pump
MAGQNIGAGKWERVSAITWSGCLLIIGVSLAIAAVLYMGAEFFVGLFVADTETVAFGAMYLQTIVFFFPFLCLNFVFNGVIRASGAMFQVLVLNLISFWVLRYPLTYLFTSWWGEQGIAYGIGTSFIISSVLAFLYYMLGGWKQVNVLEEQPAKQSAGA